MGKSELVRDVLRKIGQRVAQHTEMMRVIFHADASLDILVKRVGESDFVRFATLKYDISGKYQNRMDWIFTKEQARYVETELIGEPPVCAVLLTDFFLMEDIFCLCSLKEEPVLVSCISI